ncbi:acetyltransferase [Hymenobacter sp. YC55]|uniref:acetyltransferase n=1 Tax=Hymenobacter sp. YC55 TaxID=3034019 RepID=UPI0023F9CB62|nr:acetyltransferase [Hymenobacter sp. YC55]MDF7815124.1 acetyltransferase [Hymenobacter sp. YC55]
MLIAGAKGFAKEVFELIYLTNEQAHLAFFDNVSTDLPPHLYERQPVLQTEEEAQQWFSQHGQQFVLGIGNPKVRRLLAAKLRSCGGVLTSIISPKTSIGVFGIEIGAGSTIMEGCILTTDIGVGEGVLLNVCCTIGHDSVIGDYCELMPGTRISGHVHIGENCAIGTNAILLPGVTIGANTVIGAGSVVTKDVEANVVAVGAPAKVIKRLESVS